MRRAPTLGMLAIGIGLGSAACAPSATEVDYEVVCRTHIAVSHPALEPRLDDVDSKRIDDSIVTITLTISQSTGDAPRASCDIPVGSSDVVTARVTTRSG
jgi:hypothetical protein